MTAAMDWERSNEEYLAVALAWLRLRLRRCAEGGPLAGAPLAADAQPAPESAGSTAGKLLVPVVATSPSATESVIDITPSGVSDADLARAAEAMAAAERSDPLPALVLLAQRFGLTDFERNVLLLCVAMELDPFLGDLCAGVQGQPSVPYPTFALALTVFEDPSWQPLLPDRPLRRFNLIEIYQPPTTPLTRSALRVDERVLGYVKGVTYVDDRLSPLLLPMDEPHPAAVTPTSLTARIDRIVTTLKRTPVTTQLPVVQLVGADAPSKQLVAWRVADSLGLHLFRLPADLLPGDAGELERLARLWQRETVLVPIALYLDAADHDGAVPAAARFLSRGSGLVFVDTTAALGLTGRPGLVCDVERPSATEQVEIWCSALGDDADTASHRLAGQFDLGAPTIARIVEAARTTPGAGSAESLADRCWAISLVETRKGLDALAQRIEPKATWDDIVLPDSEMRLLGTIADQVSQRGAVYEAGGFADRTSRGLGINALFAGPSGTGKTMAAEVIANHLRLNLYRIDLSAVVSKYIGETEKNLARLFREAESGGVILFFDEADALFGKRTEVRDSHDRYANIEVSFLLQRMESYRGLSILATNMRSELDQAFVRRLRFVVPFAYPRPAERKLIWQHVFPAATLTEDLDYDRLARLNFTGGNIFGIALNAAFLAARDGTPVTMRHVLETARIEARKLERPTNEREFDLPEPVVTR